jgi:hypothetical protein
MLFSIGLLFVIFFIVFRAAPREKQESVPVHGAGQMGFLDTVAHFGVDYFKDRYSGIKRKLAPKLSSAPKKTSPGDKKGKEE